MKIEVTAKINASKSERNSQHTGYRSGYQVPRFDTRLYLACQETKESWRNRLFSCP